MGYDIPKDHHSSAPSEASSDNPYTGTDGPAPWQDINPASVTFHERVNTMIARLHSASDCRADPRNSDLMLGASRLISVLAHHVGKNPSYHDLDRLYTIAQSLALAGPPAAALPPGPQLYHSAAKAIFTVLRSMWSRFPLHPAPAPKKADDDFPVFFGADHPTCQTCIHFYRQGDSYGQCRRNAPIACTANSAAPVWPSLLFTEWCGEHKTKDGD